MSINRATIQEIECFLAVAGELNFSRAARRLHMSQPPLTRAIRQLETRIGAPLFQRTTRTVSLTPAGHLFRPEAETILNRLDGATEIARRAASGEPDRLRLAFVGALLDDTLVSVLRRFRQTHPRCQLHLADMAPGEQLEALHAGTLDGGFLGAQPRRPARQLRSFIWKREPLLLALPEDHPLASRKKIRLSHLANEGWVMVTRAAAPAFRAQFDQLCTHAGFRPRIVQESDRVMAVLTMVAAGQGTSLVPKSLTRWLDHGLTYHPLPEPDATLDHSFAWLPKRSSPALTQFMTLLQKSSTAASRRG